MKDWAEILLAMLASNGILFFAFKSWWAKRMKELEYSHELDKDKLEHKQQLEIAASKESLTHSLRKLSAERAFLNNVVSNYGADYATVLKMSNGNTYGDGDHKWKFTATLESVSGIDKGIYDILQLKPIEEAGNLFPTIQDKGFAHVNIDFERPKSTLSNRLQNKGIVSYAIVSTEDVMNSLLLCWFGKEGIETHGVDLSEDLLKQIMGDFRSMEDKLL